MRSPPAPTHREKVFRLACEHDLEGVVGKWKLGTYRSDGAQTSWLKIKNPNYSQAEGRHELFEKTPPEVGSRQVAAFRVASCFVGRVRSMILVTPLMREPTIAHRIDADFALGFGPYTVGDPLRGTQASDHRNPHPH